MCSAVSPTAEHQGDKGNLPGLNIGVNLAAVRLNHDGRPDLVVVIRSQDSDGLYVFPNRTGVRQVVQRE